MAQTYDPKEVNVIVDGVYITGFADDMIEWEKEEDDFEEEVGAQGDVEIAESHNDVHTLTITLQQTSPSNSYLMQKRNERSNFPVQIVDSNTQRFQAGGTQARIVKPAPYSRGNSTENREWEIKVFDGRQEE